jgi:phenylpyruvate tautomerase PptA (4-oxalocrotonate tautomerase family)
MLGCVADALVEALRLEPGNVWVTYEEIRPDRLATGA